MRLGLATITALTARSLVGATPAVALAQSQEAHAHGQPGERLGSVHFPTSCATGVAGRVRSRRRAAALVLVLRSDRVVQQGARKPIRRCAMAHWGIALSWWGNPFGGRRARRSALRGGPRRGRGGDGASGAGTEREKAYIAAVDAAVPRQRDASTSARARSPTRRRWRRSPRAYPDDIEARIFYALALDADGAADRQDVRRTS